LTRARFVAKLVPRSDAAALATRSFDKFEPIKGNTPEEDYVDPVKVKKDLERVVDDAERVREYAERTHAHRSKEKGLDTTLTFRDLHNAIGDLRKVIAKYYFLLVQTTIMAESWEPEPQYDTIAPFLRPWVTDPEAVVNAADRDADNG